MPDDTDAQVAPDETQTTEPATEPTPQTTQAPADSGEDPAVLRKALRKARREARNLRERTKAAEAQLATTPAEGDQLTKAEAEIVALRREAAAAKERARITERLAKASGQYRVPLDVLARYVEAESVDVDDPLDVSDAAESARRRWLAEMQEYGLTSAATAPQEPEAPPERKPSTAETAGVTGAASEEVRLAGELKQHWAAVQASTPGSREHADAARRWRQFRAKTQTTEVGAKVIDDFLASLH